ncbi:MAG: Nif3-like dinuclear metal center hexameric protein [Ignavibacteriales bacterium]|nr:Nif3-like dinuclear metal center hexameric protein [Ignavibacteriales bacterium]MCF8369219.1 Nif3-like dinuclear metal center hexameric protein [Bacteroidales bacterium]MCF8403740.1 Nif3-like dinuclear metal center hexameric protein [Bacteroidales bacterium]
MKLKDILVPLQEFAPLNLQEDYDNAGLLIGNYDQEISGVLISVDITQKVLNEALSKKCNLIISHHPMIFKGLKSITGKTDTERLVEKCILMKLAVYAMHTNLDNTYYGINDILCNKLGLINTRILSPKSDLLKKLVTFCPTDKVEKVREAIFNAGAGHIGEYDQCSFNVEGTGTFRGSENSNPFVGKKGALHYEKEVKVEVVFPHYLQNKIVQALVDSHPYEEVAYDIYSLDNKWDRSGAGKIGELQEEIDEKEFLLKVKKIVKTGCIRHSVFNNRKIKKVAVCGGAGSFLISQAKQSGADIFISGDIKYHDFFEADDKMMIADIGHYESEQYAKELIYSVLIENFSNFAVLISETNTNSVNYL